MTCQRAVHVDAQQPTRFGTGKRHLGIFDIRQNSQAALIVSLAIQRWADVASGVLQQPHLQPGLQLFDGIGHRRTWQSQILRGLGKAALFHHAGKQTHGVNSVHGIVRFIRIVITKIRGLSAIAKGA
ncbi:hypothetical protein D3C78_1497030 [compost metagenome]